MSAVTKYEDDATGEPIEDERKMVTLSVLNIETNEVVQSHLSASSYAKLISGDFNDEDFSVSNVFLHD